MSHEPAARALSERWELTSRLGAGAMGEVWRGRHRLLGHEVAIKLMKRDAARNQELVARFVREARIAAQLRHRNVARVEDLGTAADGRPFLVMELVQGEPLDALAERHGRLDRGFVATVARHVGAACDVAHAAGIVHRDLKPGNCQVVRDDDGQTLVKVLDFGVAKVSDGMVTTQYGDGGGFTLIGTPVYMSPEQVRGQGDIDGRSDLWSLAVMLYELLTGRLPFEGDTLPQLLCAITDAKPPAPSAVDPSLPMAVDVWARRALDPDRERRFASGRALADALTEALGAPSVSMPPAVAPTVESPAVLPPTAPAFAAVSPFSIGSSPSLAPVTPPPSAPVSLAGPADFTGPRHMTDPFAPGQVSYAATTADTLPRPSRGPLLALGVAALTALVGGVVALAVLRDPAPPPTPARAPAATTPAPRAAAPTPPTPAATPTSRLRSPRARACSRACAGRRARRRACSRRRASDPPRAGDPGLRAHARADPVRDPRARARAQLRTASAPRLPRRRLQPRGTLISRTALGLALLCAPAVVQAQVPDGRALFNRAAPTTTPVGTPTRSSRSARRSQRSPRPTRGSTSAAACARSGRTPTPTASSSPRPPRPTRAAPPRSATRAPPTPPPPRPSRSPTAWPSCASRCPSPRPT
ncbi:MAG: protein kinase [Polyangiales bacterium]